MSDESTVIDAEARKVAEKVMDILHGWGGSWRDTRAIVPEIAAALNAAREAKWAAPYRVACDNHNEHRPIYTDGRPLLDDRCPWCLITAAREAEREKIRPLREALYAWEQIRPDCVGEWLSGSGGHRVHGKCSEKATWFDYNDVFAYCDAHVPESDRTRGDYKHFPRLKEPAE